MICFYHKAATYDINDKIFDAYTSLKFHNKIKKKKSVIEKVIDLNILFLDFTKNLFLF